MYQMNDVVLLIFGMNTKKNAQQIRWLDKAYHGQHCQET